MTSSGGTGAVTGSGAVTSPTQSVGGIDLSSFPLGTLTYSVTLTNSIGNPTTETATADVVSSLDGFQVTPDQSTVPGGGVGSAGFALTGVEPGGTYSYTISGLSAAPIVPGGNATVTGSGSVTSNTQDVTGIDLSTLADGTVTFSVTATDAAGAASTPVTATATIDRELPTGIALSTSVALAGQPSGTLVGQLQTVGPESAADYTYALVSVNGGTQSASFPFQISGDDLLTSGGLAAVGTSYNVVVKSTDPLGKSIQQSVTITVGTSNPSPRR